jgi:RNA polymerase sigma-70 factor (ECF subfamily)
MTNPPDLPRPPESSARTGGHDLGVADPLRDDGRLTALLQRCGAADAQALAELYRLTSPLLLGCLQRILKRRALAEEALQDVYVRVWRSAAQYDAYRGRALAWLVSIARYRAIDILRHERALPVDPATLADVAAIDDTVPADVASARDLAALAYCMEQLSADQRGCLELAYRQGETHQDIAATLGRPIGSVKSWIRRGLQSLKECLQTCVIPVRN